MEDGQHLYQPIKLFRAEGANRNRVYGSGVLRTTFPKRLISHFGNSSRPCRSRQLTETPSSLRANLEVVSDRIYFNVRLHIRVIRRRDNRGPQPSVIDTRFVAGQMKKLRVSVDPRDLWGRRGESDKEFFDINSTNIKKGYLLVHLPCFCSAENCKKVCPVPQFQLQQFSIKPNRK